ncbi:MBL fold metallo-hydrolase [Natronosalvus vescus]|uniref:MBL fold metallo-hydrolase n=1 Tax=Natronosalvus vescus TaxID=2953881 RepID=UPI00209105FC|nr:MBL fold metallo-hydrolase [Natronosalvus vescus]
MTVTRHPVPVSTRAPGGETNAYVVGDRPAALIDPAGRTAALDRTVDERDVEHVLVTHTHPDHVGAVATYADELDATVWARHGHDHRFTEATGIDPDATFTPGSTIALGDELLEMLDTPGHATDHVSFRLQPGGSIVVGDCAVAEGSVVVGAPDGDMRAYLTSLRRLRAMAPSRLYPGHGLVIDEPRVTLERLIDHRLQRERRVRTAVQNGARTPDAILEAAYDVDLTGVRDLARATVVAHLEKLAVEGAVELAWDGDRIRSVLPSAADD